MRTRVFYCRDKKGIWKKRVVEDGVYRKRLTKEEVMVIKGLLKYTSLTHLFIANIFNVSKTLITLIKKGDRWASV